jgi:hypothetical protein
MIQKLPSCDTSLTSTNHPATYARIMLRGLAAVLTACVFLCAACGKSGEEETRPIEVIFSVTGPTGANFEVVALQAENADHRFEGRVFEAPHLFVMENATQWVQGIFKNNDPEMPLVVELSFGTDLVSRQEIRPGACCTVTPGADCSQATEDCGEVSPKPMTREVRFEAFSLAAVSGIALAVTIGDEANTYITACAYGSAICRTPATFFIEEAKNVVSGVFTKLSNQDPETPFEVDLYVDGTLRARETDTGDVILSYEF